MKSNFVLLAAAFSILRRHYLPKLLAVGTLFCSVSFLCLLTGCANIQAPMGGAKDTIPPVLLEAVPKENTINFKGNTIRLAFSEYVKLDNLNENLIINPPAEKFPLITSKLRNVSIKMLDTLKPNTTYTLNFGNAVKDVNESNPLKNFSYSFSTGQYIDSLELAGKLLDAETGIPDSTMIIMLHSTEADSAVAKTKPMFVTRPNGQGIFHFDHLPGGRFFIFALRDEGNKRYTNPQTPFAFYDEKVTAGKADSIVLRFFSAEKEPEKKAKSSSATGKNDKKEEKKLQYTTSATGGQDLLAPLTITFQHKIAGFDTAKMVLTDTLQKPVGYLASLDSNVLKVDAKWKENENYRLLLQKGFARDSVGTTTSRSDTIKFKTRQAADYGSVKLKFSGVDLNRNPVLQFVEESKIVFTVPLTANEYNNKMFMPGQYKLRVLYDANKNGRWDTGNYWKKLQPELVVPVEKPVNIKANWDNEIEIRL